MLLILTFVGGVITGLLCLSINFRLIGVLCEGGDRGLTGLLTN